jgi:hypothetical protein
MRKSYHHALRELLHRHPDGLTVKEMVLMTKRQESPIRRTLKMMPDVYRDRWIAKPGRQPSAVFVAIKVPEDCPKPSRPKV